MTKFLLSILFGMGCLLTSAQDVDDEKVDFMYNRKPLFPVVKECKTYNAVVGLTYMAEERAKAAAYEAEKMAAKEKYDQEKEDQKNKSFSDKVVEKMLLGETEKPTLEYVVKPYIRKSFDETILANTYIKFDGYTKGTDNAATVTFVNTGFEYLDPTTETVSKTVDGKPVTMYKMKIGYRSPVSVEVKNPDGSIVFAEGVAKSLDYTYWLSAEAASKDALQRLYDPEKFMPNLESKILADNLKLANILLNEKCGWSKLETQILLHNVESKKVDYSDYSTAFLGAMEGYAKLSDFEDEAKAKLKESIAIWNKALTESNVADKKARVNEEVTIATVFNVAIANMWCEDYMASKTALAKLATLDLSKREDGRREALGKMIDDQKARTKANE